MVGLRGDEEVPGQPGLHRDLTAGKDARTMEKLPLPHHGSHSEISHWLTLGADIYLSHFKNFIDCYCICVHDVYM